MNAQIDFKKYLNVLHPFKTSLKPDSIVSLNIESASNKKSKYRILPIDLTSEGTRPKLIAQNIQSKKNLFLKGPYVASTEAYGSFYAPQILEALDFNELRPVTNRQLLKLDNKLWCSCDVIEMLENQSLVPLDSILDPLNELSKLSIDDRRESFLKLLPKIYTIYGKSNFEDLMLYDSIVYSYDTHLGNVAVLEQIHPKDSSRILKPSPVFDNELNFLGILADFEFENLEQTLMNERSWFGFTFDELGKMFVQPRHIENLRNLEHFVFERHSQYSRPEKVLKLAEEFIQRRSKFLIEISQEKKIEASLFEEVLESNYNELNFDNDFIECQKQSLEKDSENLAQKFLSDALKASFDSAEIKKMSRSL